MPFSLSNLFTACFRGTTASPQSPSDHQTEVIEMTLASPIHLFNSMDSSPFRDRDLDNDADEFLRDALVSNHSHHSDPITLRLNFTDGDYSDLAGAISRAIKGHFRYRCELESRRLRARVRSSLGALLFGVMVMSVLLLSSLLIQSRAAQGAVIPIGIKVICSGLEIIGWASLWIPVERMFSFWGEFAQIKVLKRLSEVFVEVRVGQEDAHDALVPVLSRMRAGHDPSKPFLFLPHLDLANSV